MSTSETLFSRAFDEVRVGDVHASERRAIAASDVDVFAALTGDRHPVHTDPAWAAASPFGERIAHGMLVVSAAVGALPLDPERIVALRRVSDLVFKRPVAVGEGIRVRCELTDKRVIDERTGLVSCEWRIEGDDGRLRARAAVEVIWRREGAGDASPNGASSAAARGDEGEDSLGPVERVGGGLQVLI